MGLSLSLSLSASVFGCSIVRSRPLRHQSAELPSVLGGGAIGRAGSLIARCYPFACMVYAWQALLLLLHL